MERRTLVADIKSSFDEASFLNINQVAKYLGVCRDTARVFLKGLEYTPFGNEKNTSLEMSLKKYTKQDQTHRKENA